MKHLEKILSAICLAFYTWGFIDDGHGQWPMIGGNLTLIALIAEGRKKKGERIFDLSVLFMVICNIALLCLQIADHARD